MLPTHYWEEVLQYPWSAHQEQLFSLSAPSAPLTLQSPQLMRQFPGAVAVPTIKSELQSAGAGAGCQMWMCRSLDGTSVALHTHLRLHSPMLAQ